jgi:hypothetical protein
VLKKNAKGYNKMRKTGAEDGTSDYRILERQLQCESRKRSDSSDRNVVVIAVGVAEIAISVVIEF